MTTFAQRLSSRADGAVLATCVGIDPSPDALALLGALGPWIGRSGRTTRSAAIERFAGLVIESARDHAVAVKPQLAWFEAAGAPGIRALERVVEFARCAGLLVVLDAKRGDVPHSAEAYADAWLGANASSGIGGDALTVQATVGADAVTAMAQVAASRCCGLYALVHTSNPGATSLQGAVLADGRNWWQALAGEIAAVDDSVGGGVVGAVVAATHPQTLQRVRAALPSAALLVPGIGAQGGSISDLQALVEGPESAPPVLVTASRSLLPQHPSTTVAFRMHTARSIATFDRDVRRSRAGSDIAVVQ